MSRAKRRGKLDAGSPTTPRVVRRRWRDYKTPLGRSPVEDFIDALSDSDAAAVLAGMQDVRDLGLAAARHVDGDIWEVRVQGDRVIYRILFAEEGARGQVLLALEAFKKKTQKTPATTIALAKRRLLDWRRRGEQKRRASPRGAA
jgi:phage-related protein